MPATLATVSALTKEVYQGTIRDQLSDEAVGFKRLERTSDGVESQVGGKYVTFPLRVRRNAGIGYRNELEQLQAGGQQGYVSVRVGLKYGYGRVRLSGQLIELADTNYQAFANAMDEEMSGLKGDIAKDTNRVFYGDGKGTLAAANATYTAVSVIPVASTKYIEPGFQVDLLSADGLTVRAADRQVTAVGTNTVTISGATATGVAGDVLVRQGNYGREPNGLGSLVTNSGVLQNLDPAVEPSWKANVDSNGGTLRPLSEGMLIKNTDDIRTKSGGQTTLLLAGLGVRRAYFNLLSQQRRYPSTTSFAGGLTGLAFNNGREIPFVDDPDMPDNTIYGLEEKSLKIYRDHDWSFINRDGSIWKWVHDYDAYEAILSQYWEIGVNARNHNFVIKDIIEG